MEERSKNKMVKKLKCKKDFRIGIRQDGSKYRLKSYINKGRIACNFPTKK